MLNVAFYVAPLVVLAIGVIIVLMVRNERREDRERRMRAHMDSRIQPRR